MAYVDIGTNSVRLMVVRFAPDHSWTVLSMQKETVRLGEGEFGEVRAAAAGGDGAGGHGVRAVRRPRAHARRHPVRHRGDGGHARGAQRATSSCACCTRPPGSTAHVVSGQEEARLIYLGLLSRVHVDGRALVIDIGGGSTEVAVGDATGADVVESVSLGAIRLFTEGPQPDARGPLHRRATTRRSSTGCG